MSVQQRESREEAASTATAAPDYFSVFALPRKLNIDTDALQKQFYSESRRLHPDRFAGKPEAEQQWATERSSLLNDSYRALKDPIARTEYLLSLEGVQLEEQSKSATDAARASGKAKQQTVPPELLEEVFDLNMQLQELRMAHEMGEAADADTTESLKLAKANFEARLVALDTELRSIWTEWDSLIDANASDEPGRKALRDRMVDLLNRRNYIRNLVRDVNDALDKASA